MARTPPGYTRLVRGAKIALPVGAVVLIGAIFLSGRDESSGLFTAAELAALGSGLRLEQPRFTGVTENDEPFVVEAAWALPDGAMANTVTLEKPTGRITLSTGVELTATAAEGLMHRKDETLALGGGVVIETSDGYHVETEALDIDLRGRTAASRGRITGRGPAGEIEAGSFRSSGLGKEDAGAQIWFENGVRLVFIPGNAK